MTLLAAAGVSILYLTAPTISINQGRVLMRKGDLAGAIAVYREELRRQPADRELQGDLQAARHLVTHPTVKTVPRDYCSDLRHRFSQREVFIGFCFGLAITAIALGNFMTSRAAWSKPLLLLGISLTVLFAGFGWVIEQQIDTDRATPFGVVNRMGVLREGNGESYPAVLETALPVGTEFTIRQRRGEWLQVALPDGTPGWIRSGDVIVKD